MGTGHKGVETTAISKEGARLSASATNFVAEMRYKIRRGFEVAADVAFNRECLSIHMRHVIAYLTYQRT